MAKFPSRLVDCAVSKLNYPQYAIMAEWLNMAGPLRAAKGRAAMDKLMQEVFKAQPELSQRAYEYVVLCKQPDDKPLNDKEQRFVELASGAAMSVLGAFDAQAAQVLEAMNDTAQREVKRMAKEAVREAAANATPLIIKDAGKVRKVKGVLPPEFQKMVQLASARIPILLVGPAGCGKTYLCEKLGEALDLEVSDQSCSEGMSESVFNGRLLPIGKGGAFEHVPSPFMTRYENGGIMLLDEIDAGDPNLFTYINKAIANSSYTVEQRWTKPVVKKSKDFVLAAAANTFGNGADAMYVGRNQLDAATLDRFKVGLITMDYSRDVEASLAHAELCDWAWKIRDGIRKNQLRRVMSTRVIKDLACMTSMYDWKTADWASTYFAGWTEAERQLVTA